MHWRDVRQQETQSALAGMAAAMDFTLRPATNADRAFIWDLRQLTMRPLIEPLEGWDESTQRGYAMSQSQAASSSSAPNLQACSPSSAGRRSFTSRGSRCCPGCRVSGSVRL